jgi:hypothetical protein
MPAPNGSVTSTGYASLSLVLLFVSLVAGTMPGSASRSMRAFANLPASAMSVLPCRSTSTVTDLRSALPALSGVFLKCSGTDSVRCEPCSRLNFWVFVLSNIPVILCSVLPAGGTVLFACLVSAVVRT